MNDAGDNNKNNAYYIYIGLSFVLIHVILYTLAGVFNLGKVPLEDGQLQVDDCLAVERITTKSLFVYSYKETSDDDANNLLYFCEVGIRKEDPMDYLILVKGVLSVQIPKYANVKVIQVDEKHEGASDWEIWKIGLDRAKKRLSNYHFFFFMDGSVRGPFIPAYWYPPDSTELEKSEVYHWSTIFTLRLTDKVKLVGATLKCVNEGSRKGPVVDSYFWAVDRTALNILTQIGGPLSHQRPPELNITEYKATHLILQSGYNIDSLLLAYANKEVDWRDTTNWNCNNHVKPTNTNSYFGATTHPLEVVFFKKHWDDDVQSEAFDRYSKWTMESTRIGKLLDVIHNGKTLDKEVEEELRHLQEAPRYFDPLLPHFNSLENTEL